MKKLDLKKFLEENKAVATDKVGMLAIRPMEAIYNLKGGQECVEAIIKFKNKFYLIKSGDDYYWGWRAFKTLGFTPFGEKDEIYSISEKEVFYLKIKSGC
jgi:hypothetical protein